MDHDIYLSPFSWRYGSDAMRRNWSESNKRKLWRRIWLALAEAQAEYGIVTQEQVADLRKHIESIDIKRSLEIEAQISHDLMAEVKAFAEQCAIGGGIIHLGATSVDVEDNADALRIRQALTLIQGEVTATLELLADMIDLWADLPIMAMTHLQPAEPSTLGYRLAQYAQDLLMDHRALAQVQRDLRGKGFKGAVGTGASYGELIGIEHLSKFEQRLSQLLDLEFFLVTTQTYPRKQEYQIISALAGLGATLYKFAFDLRILHSSYIGELSEPFGKHQVGSSAMPFKRNPINAEKMDALGRMLAQYPRLAWDNAAHSLLERTLDDSANRRSMLPESFLICDEMLRVAQKLLSGLQVNQEVIERNFERFAPFAGTERLLMALVEQGADRQKMHEAIRLYALEAWEAVQQDEPNPLGKLIRVNKVFLEYFSESDLRALLNPSEYVGFAPQRARELAKDIRIELSTTSN